MLGLSSRTEVPAITRPSLAAADLSDRGRYDNLSDARRGRDLLDGLLLGLGAA